MPRRDKFGTLAAIGVAVAFQWFFMFTKHDPGLRPIIPFGDDPYDALGSMATIVDILLVLLLLARTFRFYGGRRPSPARIQYLRRTQATIPLSILVTLAANSIAMARHPGMWVGTGSQNRLIVVFAGMAVLSGGCLWLIRSSASRPPGGPQRNALISSIIVAVLFVLILAFYPEQWINRLLTHLLTVLIGDALLFVPVSVLLSLCLPEPAGLEGIARGRRVTAYLWLAAMLFSASIGVWLYLAEMGDGGGPMPPIRMRLVIASVYIGLTVGGVLIAFALLKRPLGIGQTRLAEASR